MHLWTNVSISMSIMLAVWNKILDLIGQSQMFGRNTTRRSSQAVWWRTLRKAATAMWNSSLPCPCPCTHSYGYLKNSRLFSKKITSIHSFISVLKNSRLFIFHFSLLKKFIYFFSKEFTSNISKDFRSNISKDFTSNNSKDFIPCI